MNAEWRASLSAGGNINVASAAYTTCTGRKRHKEVEHMTTFQAFETGRKPVHQATGQLG